MSVKYRAIAVEETQVLEEITALQRKLALSQTKDPEKSGFLISGYSVKDLQELLREGATVIIATESEKLIGYYLFTTGKSFNERHKSSRFDWKVKTAQKDVEKGTFTYMDQMGIEEEHRGNGILESFLREMYHRRPVGELFMGAILVSPHSNTRSKKAFVDKLGYEIAGEVTTPHIGKIENVKSIVITKRNKR